MEMSLSSHHTESMVVVAVVMSLGFVAPVGLIVLRKHLANARGGRLALKMILLLATVITSPLAGMAILTVLFGGAEATETLWSMLVDAW